MQFFKIILIAIVFIFVNINTSRAGILEKLIRYNRLSQKAGCKKIVFIAKIKSNGKYFTLATIIADDKNIEIIANGYDKYIDYVVILLEAQIPDIDQQKAQIYNSNAYINIKIGVPLNGNVIIPNFFHKALFSIQVAYLMYGKRYKTNIYYTFKVCYP